MFKYPGGPRILEINGVSKPPKAARLNVQFILLLLSLGVRMEVGFVSLPRESMLLTCGTIHGDL